MYLGVGGGEEGVQGLDGLVGLVRVDGGDEDADGGWVVLLVGGGWVGVGLGWVWRVGVGQAIISYVPCHWPAEAGSPPFFLTVSHHGRLALRPCCRYVLLVVFLCVLLVCAWCGWVG